MLAIINWFRFLVCAKVTNSKVYLQTPHKCLMVDHFHRAIERPRSIYVQSENCFFSIFTMDCGCLIYVNRPRLLFHTQPLHEMAPKSVVKVMTVRVTVTWLLHMLNALRMPAPMLCIETMAAIFVHCCPICNFTTSTLTQWFSHLRSSHSSDPSFCVTCGIDGCKKTYSKFSSLNTHVY